MSLSKAVFSEPKDLFSYAADRLKTIPASKLMPLITPGESISEDELTNKVRTYISPGATDKDILRAVYELKAETGIEVVHSSSYQTFQVRHSKKSAALYPEYLTSIFFPDIWLEKVKFPGTGEKKDDECGEIKGWKVCSHNPTHYKRPRVHSCNRKECPVCYTNWINQAVRDRILPRMEGFEEALKQEHMKRWGRPGKVWPARHFSLSPPEEEIRRMKKRAINAIKKDGNEDYMRKYLPGFLLEELMQISYVALEKSGLKGATVIPHFHRIKDEYKDFAVKLAAELNKDLDDWKPKYNRYTALTTLENYHQYLYFYPHIHVLAYGKAVNSEEFEKDIMPGWVYTNHSEEKKHRKSKGNGYGAVLHYILTHSPVIEGKQIIRYWGCLASKRLKCIKSESALEEETCPDCGAAVCPAVFSNLDGEGDLLEIDRVHPVLKKVILKDYVIVGKAPPI